MAMATAPVLTGFDGTQAATLSSWIAQVVQQERATTNVDFQTLVARMNGSDLKIDGILEQANAISVKMTETLTLHNVELHQSSDRMTANVAQIIQLKSDIEQLVENTKTELESQNAKALDLNSRLVVLTKQMNEYSQTSAVEQSGVQGVIEQSKAAAVKEIERLREDTKDWARGMQARILEGGARGSSPSSKGGSGMDRKDLAVWKLPDNVGKTEFRHWIDAINVNLEMIHNWKHADIVLNRVKRHDTELSQDSLTTCVAEAVEEVSLMIGYEELAPGDYVFADKAKFFHAFLLGKLNTDLHEKMVGITDKNGFEMYRQICQTLDAVPENAEFVMNANLVNLASIFSKSVTDLKSLYGFRLLLKKKNAEFKKVIGKEPEHAQSKIILWNVLDPASRLQAKTDSLAEKDYAKMCEWIDLRHRIMFGNLDYKPTGKDDPMGLALVGESIPDGPPPGLAEDESANLDAMGKGKGKGDGKCHVCNGDGHYARDCPSVPPIGPQDVECLGCNGRGHYRNKCPTYNPHLKGKGKGKGDSGGWGKGGKGYGDSGGWGKGGKGKGGKGSGGWGKGGKGKGGKGVSALDLMGSQSGEGSWGGNWGNDPPWQDDCSSDHSWQNNSFHSMSPWYGKSLAALSPANSHPPVPTPTSNRFSPISTSILLPSFSSVKCLMVRSCPCQIPIALSIIPLLLDARTGDSIGTVSPERAAATARFRATMAGSWSDLKDSF